MKGTDRQTDFCCLPLLRSGLLAGRGRAAPRLGDGPALAPAATPGPAPAARRPGGAARTPGPGAVYTSFSLCRVPRSDSLQAPQSRQACLLPPPRSPVERWPVAPGDLWPRAGPPPASHLAAESSRKLRANCNLLFLFWQGVVTGLPTCPSPPAFRGRPAVPWPPGGAPRPRGEGTAPKRPFTLTVAHTLHFFPFDMTKKDPNV